MIKYFNIEEQLNYESIPTEITGPRKEGAILSNPTRAESKIEMQNYFKNHKFILETLSEREKMHFVLLYGLKDGKIRNLQEVGVIVGVTRERVRQVIAKALRKLRHPSRIQLCAILNDADVDFDMIKKDKDYFIKLKETRMKEIEKTRYDVLSEEEKTAHELMTSLLLVDLKGFLRGVGSKNIDTTIEKLSKISDIRNQKIYIRDVIKIPTQKLKEEGLEKLVKTIKEYGLHFEEETKYREDFNKMCYRSMKKIGFDKIYNDCPVVYKGFLGNLIDDLDLSIRSYNCLKRSKIHTVWDVVQLTYGDLLKIRNLGKKHADEVVEKISKLGLELRPERIDNTTWKNMIETKFQFKTVSEAKEAARSAERSKYVDVLLMPIEELNFSIRAYNCLRRGGMKTVKDIISTPYEKLIKIRNLGKKALDEVSNKLKDLDLQICPDYYDSPEEWLKDEVERLKKKDEEKAEGLSSNKSNKTVATGHEFEIEKTKTQKKLNVNDIPEEYRRVYAIGAGVIAKEEMNKGLISRSIKGTISKPKSDGTFKIITNLPKVDINQMSDEQVLEIINDDISLIDMLETSFIVEYKDQLIKAILSNTNVDVEQRFKILNFVNDAKIEEITK